MYMCWVPGAGKTTAVKALSKRLNGRILLATHDGSAAQFLPGCQTLHRLFGFSLDVDTCQQYPDVRFGPTQTLKAEAHRLRLRGYLGMHGEPRATDTTPILPGTLDDMASAERETGQPMHANQNVFVLLVDETSLITPNMLANISRVLKKATGCDYDFGNLLVILSGDFFQISPVSGVSLYKSAMRALLNPESMTPGTPEADGVQLLLNFTFRSLESDQHRSQDPEHTRKLNGMRTLKSIRPINREIYDYIVSKEIDLTQKNNDHHWSLPTILTPTNAVRERMNWKQTCAHAVTLGQPVYCWNRQVLDSPDSAGRWDALSDQEKEMHFITQPELSGKFVKGGKAYLIEQNLNPAKELVNGTSGTLHSLGFVEPKGSETVIREWKTKHELDIKDMRDAKPGQIVRLRNTPCSVNIAVASRDNPRKWPYESLFPNAFDGSRGIIPVVIDSHWTKKERSFVNTINTSKNGGQKMSRTMYSTVMLPSIVVNTPNRHGSVPLPTRPCKVVVKKEAFTMGYALTYNKAQGATLDRVVLDLPARDSLRGRSMLDASKVYVGLSRVRQGSHIRVMPLRSATAPGGQHSMRFAHLFDLKYAPELLAWLSGFDDAGRFIPEKAVQKYNELVKEDSNPSYDALNTSKTRRRTLQLTNSPLTPGRQHGTSSVSSSSAAATFLNVPMSSRSSSVTQAEASQNISFAVSALAALVPVVQYGYGWNFCVDPHAQDKVSQRQFIASSIWELVCDLADSADNDPLWLRQMFATSARTRRNNPIDAKSLIQRFVTLSELPSPTDPLSFWTALCDACSINKHFLRASDLLENGSEDRYLTLNFNNPGAQPSQLQHMIRVNAAFNFLDVCKSSPFICISVDKHSEPSNLSFPERWTPLRTATAVPFTESTSTECQLCAVICKQGVDSDVFCTYRQHENDWICLGQTRSSNLYTLDQIRSNTEHQVHMLLYRITRTQPESPIETGVPPSLQSSLPIGRHVQAGLNNPSPKHTCFINVVLKTFLFTDIFMTAIHQKKSTPMDISCALKMKLNPRAILGHPQQCKISAITRFVQDMIALSESGQTCTPTRFLHVDGLKQLLPGYTKGVHQDAEEYYTSILEKLQQDKELEDSHCCSMHNIIFYIFGSVHRRHYTCNDMNCAVHNHNDETGCGPIPLKMPQNGHTPVDIFELFQKYFADDIVERNCPKKCGSNYAKVENHLARAPNILVLQLARFRHDDRATKICQAVKYTESLDITGIVNREEHTTYNLYAVVVHLGLAVTSGHYIVYIKTANQWYRHDDERVTECDFEACQNEGANDAYLLFYHVQNLPLQSTP